MKNYETVVEALNDLKKKGYTTDFNLAFDKISCSQTGICLDPSEFEIIEVHRFEGNTDPDDQDVLYVVESKNGKLKGTITSAYGMYADTVNNDMISKLSIHDK